jgi:ribonuclease R
VKNQKNTKKEGPMRHKLSGVISISSKGTGYVAIDAENKKNKGQDPEIAFEHLNTALNGDTVEILLHSKKGNGKTRSAFAKSYGETRQTAEVTKIISRAKMRFVGVLESENGVFFLKPDDTKMYTDILIPEKDLGGAKVGQKVFAEIVSWVDPHKAPIGSIVKILGRPGENNTEMHAIAIEKGFDATLPHRVEDEAKIIKQNGIQEKDYAGRRDFRKVLTFTIDPSDAKDFDDAISFEEKNGEYEIGIHIADVSYYVRPGTELDNEARERGTSVYLVDRTIPMLPEILSNDLCSLVPHKDRLTMSAVFVVDKNCTVKSEWFGRTVIHSQKRFTYEEAEESIHKSTAPLHRELSILNNLAKKLNKKRFEAGAISLEQEEVKFVLDKNGTPTKVIKKERGDSNKLIEEFMLLANRKVAELLSPKKHHKKSAADDSVSLYRVHDLPSQEKMADLAFFLRSLGYKITMKDGIIPTYEINKLLGDLSKQHHKNDMSDTVHRAVIRSMAKAIYSTKNIGHYGLAFHYYTHFTSPIRRYPDIIIHRLLMDHLMTKKIKSEDIRSKLFEYEKMAKVASEDKVLAGFIEKYKSNPIMATDFSKMLNISVDNPQEVNSLKAFIDDLFVTVYSGKYKFKSMIDKMAALGGLLFLSVTLISRLTVSPGL